MRSLRVLPLLLAVAFVWALNHSFGSLPAIGKIIDPVNGAMASAESLNEDWNRNLRLKDLKAPVQIWLDTSLIPRIRAGNDHDLYYTQGYIHATFRLWQMDLQTRAAWGRVSEVAGPKAIDFDRGMRREGMVWGAQHSLETMEREPRTKAMLDAYRDGINAYIHSLNFRKLPIEYKLMGFVPEDWTNLRTALLMKYMARDLTGKTDDIAYTQLRDQLGQEEFDFLFPERIKGSKPVIPEGTKWESPSLPIPPVPKTVIPVHLSDSPNIQSGLPKKREKVLSIAHPVSNYQYRIPERKEHYLDTSYIIPKGGMMYEETGIVYKPSVIKTSVSRIPNFIVGTGYSYFRNSGESSGSEYFFNGNDGIENGTGSNNWAISGNHTASGKPILCNDPHLQLNLPSLWYEMQLTAPGINAYGASLPGAPGIVIGFNEKISWGFTNNYRDVKDFYEIKPATPRPPKGGDVAYVFNGKAIPFEKRIEVIKVKGQPDVIDTVRYTIHGPVTYDPSFPPPTSPPAPLPERRGGKAVAPAHLLGRGGTAVAPSPLVERAGVRLLACTWMAHRGSNELLATYLLNRAGDYAAFTDAISHFECPAQNIAYADGAGNIAMWGQGRFINKWKGQGKYVMRGDDSATLWGDAIPWQENPHVLNPPQGYVASANQQVTDSTYPYWYNQSFTEWRSWEINQFLLELTHDAMFKMSLRDMMQIQNYSGSELWWRIIKQTPYKVGFDPEVNIVIAPDLSLDATSKEATEFQIWWSQLYKDIWQDEFQTGTKYPSSELTVQLLLSDSTSKYYDDKRTQEVETLRDIVQRAFRETTDSLDALRRNAPRRVPTGEKGDDALQWYKVKNTSLTHLAKIPAFSYDHLKIGGWSNTINACTGDHGPSWRMIVEMDSIPHAYAIYPGGQSGNPGSPHYGDFIQQWVEGKYHAIQFLTAAVTKNPLKYTWTLTP